jgi:hypothetical protein
VTPSQEWDPWDRDRGLEIKPQYAAPDPAPGSVRQYLRQNIGPRLIAPDAPVNDHLSATRGEVHDTITRTAPKGKAAKLRAGTWTTTNETWKGLTTYEKAAAMSLMEADRADPDNAKNALAAMVNRAYKNKNDLGEHVSSRLYQPSFEPAQEKRLGGIVKMPAFKALTAWAQSYSDGNEDDPTGGATHFLAHAPVMLSLEAEEPWKYRSWRGWSGYDPVLRDYRNVTFKDRSHSFVAPEGAYSVARTSK